MLDEKIRKEMVFYATQNDYSNAGRYERFCLDCRLDLKGFEIGNVVKDIAKSFQYAANRPAIGRKRARKKIGEARRPPHHPRGQLSHRQKIKFFLL
ncbi:hypothetical protein A2924_01700 [Candidatus Giovannonibacteria bacterium RIFCSPLOWO2_01_FULL_44_16]|uniref:Uncharacterized protein n=1 Tax=Candidatus Giovannonibacteria bacterium RIFCSPLOWO2_01_FULL_44_16 TaxID=1798348 RepID=A0A1F5X4E0_9BACT|nr:MAG: hypothetical protein A2924_01700 [Candidatus Giovannonibacteria bacterium RIFCSPLOWO2_01_FULL_44_16]